MQKITISGRQTGIDALKGFAMILVVVGHVISGFNKSGFYSPGEAALAGKIDAGINLFHMPLFIMVSGYIFALSCTADGMLLNGKVKKKACNLVCIYIIFNILYGIVKLFMARWVNSELEWKDLLLIPFRAIDLYWYLYVLICLYLFVLLLDKVYKEKRKTILFLLAVISAAYPMVLSNAIKINLTIFLCLYYAFFFIRGYEVYREKKRSLWKLYVIEGVIGLAGMALLVMGFESMAMHKIAAGFAKFVTAFCISDVLLHLFLLPRRNWGGVLAYLGTHSWELYTLHIFVTSGIRPVLRMLHIDGYLPGLVLGSVLGIGIPLICSVLLKKIKLWDMFYKPIQFWTGIIHKPEG